MAVNCNFLSRFRWVLHRVSGTLENDVPPRSNLGKRVKLTSHRGGDVFHIERGAREVDKDVRVFCATADGSKAVDQSQVVQLFERKVDRETGRVRSHQPLPNWVLEL